MLKRCTVRFSTLADFITDLLRYALVDRRHEQRSTIVTTNLSFKQWGTVFPGAACVVALVDPASRSTATRRHRRRLVAAEA